MISYKYSPQACVFKKSYGDAQLTIVLELPDDTKFPAIHMLKDEIHNMLNDAELDNLFKAQGDGYDG